MFLAESKENIFIKGKKKRAFIFTVIKGIRYSDPSFFN
jgi:hypothetical protein